MFQKNSKRFLIKFFLIHQIFFLNNRKAPKLLKKEINAPRFNNIAEFLNQSSHTKT